MSYVPNASQTTEPLASRSVESAALEFRTLKSYLTAQLATLVASDAVLTASDASLTAQITVLADAIAAMGGGGGSIGTGTIYTQRFSGTGAQVAYTLITTPLASFNVDVYVNGVYQQHNTFTVAGNILTFSEAPTTGTNNIEVQIESVESLDSITLPSYPAAEVTAANSVTLSNKTITLGSNSLSGTIAQFNAAVTDGDLVSQGSIEVLTNKTLTNPTITNPTITNYTETVNAPVAGSSFTVALTTGTIQKLTTNANTTITLPASVAGKNFSIIVAYGGAHTITWAGGGVLKWAGGTAPTATSVNGKFDIFVFTQDGTNTYGRSGGSNF